MPAVLPAQPEINIGTLGHVDNGKSTIVEAMTGIWTARHSEELRRGITIKLGYADTAVYKCPSCPEPEAYITTPKCPRCGSEAVFQRAISFIDCPGHHSLMVTMLSGAALFDGGLFVVDSRVTFPQLQDGEHLLAASILGVENMVVAQNKIDLVTREEALKNYEEVIEGVRGTAAEGAPVIPVSGQHATNIDSLIQAIEKHLPTPARDLSKPAFMPVLRSFDVNQPGVPADKIRGGVLGGSLLQGVLKVGDDLEIKPGTPKKAGDPRSGHTALVAEVKGIMVGGREVESAKSGGLLGVETTLDPSLSRADGLTMNIAGPEGTLPPVWDALVLRYQLFERVVGATEHVAVKPLSKNEPLVLNVYSTVASGIVTERSRDDVTVRLGHPVCAREGDNVTISRRIGAGWRLIGFGKIA